MALAGHFDGLVRLRDISENVGSPEARKTRGPRSKNTTIQHVVQVNIVYIMAQQVGTRTFAPNAGRDHVTRFENITRATMR